jgi:hypothetical protein
MSLIENTPISEPHSQAAASASPTMRVRYWTAAERWAAVTQLPQFNSPAVPPRRMDASNIPEDQVERDSIIEQEDEDRLVMLHGMWDDWDQDH